MFKTAIVVKDDDVDYAATVGGRRSSALWHPGGRVVAHDALDGLVHRRGRRDALGCLGGLAKSYRLIIVKGDCSARAHVLALTALVLECDRGVVGLLIIIIASTQDHLTVTKHEPHHVQARVGAVDLADDLVADFLVASVEQLG